MESKLVLAKLWRKTTSTWLWPSMMRLYPLQARCLSQSASVEIRCHIHHPHYQSICASGGQLGSSPIKTQWPACMACSTMTSVTASTNLNCPAFKFWCLLFAPQGTIWVAAKVQPTKIPKQASGQNSSIEVMLALRLTTQCSCWCARWWE